MGGNGIALGAVADGIQRLATDSAAQTEAVAQGIREVADRSGALSAELAASSEDLIGELEQMMAAYHAADAESRQRLVQVDELGRGLARELETLQQAVTADGLVAAAAERSVARLGQVAGQAGRLAAPDADQDAAIARLEERYTMHAERLVHDQVMAACAGPPAATTELGDNIELF